MYVSTFNIVAERGRPVPSNQENRHGSNGLIGKLPTMLISRRDGCEERHPGHPGVTTEAIVGVWRQRADEMSAEGVRYTPLGLHTALDMFYII